MVADFNKKQKGKFFTEKLLFKVVGILFLIIILVLILADLKIFQKKQNLASQIESLQKQVEDIKQSSKTLKEEIANADEPDYLEKIAYEQGMAKTGEKEIIFITPPEKSKTPASSNNFWDVKLWLGWLNGSWQWIKNKF